MQRKLNEQHSTFHGKGQDSLAILTFFRDIQCAAEILAGNYFVLLVHVLYAPHTCPIQMGTFPLWDVLQWRDDDLVFLATLKLHWKAFFLVLF